MAEENNGIASKDPAIIIVDTSFLLNSICQNGSGRKKFITDGRLFRDRCKLVWETCGTESRIIPSIFGEIWGLTRDSAHNPLVREGLEYVRKIERNTPNGEESTLKRLREIIAQDNLEICERYETVPLSRADIDYCSYAISQLRKGHVIAATNDSSIKNTLGHALMAHQDNYRQAVNGDYSLYIPGSKRALEKILSLRESFFRLSVMHNVRKMDGEPRRSEYGKRAREIWLGRYSSLA